MSNVEIFERTKEEQERCIVIHDASRAELLKRQLSNSESYDKAILSLSSAGLALSLTAIKFIVPLNTANYLWAVETSWILFFITITTSLCAFLVGNAAISKQLSIEEDYYVKGLVKAQTENNVYSKINSILNSLTGIVFVGAIFLVILFVTLNVSDGDRDMSKGKNKSGPKSPATLKFTDSAPIPKMQIAPGSKSKSTASADVPKMQLAPGTPPATKPAGGSEAKSKPKK